MSWGPSSSPLTIRQLTVVLVDRLERLVQRARRQDVNAGYRLFHHSLTYTASPAKLTRTPTPCRRREDVTARGSEGTLGGLPWRSRQDGYQALPVINGESHPKPTTEPVGAGTNQPL